MQYQTMWEVKKEERMIKTLGNCGWINNSYTHPVLWLPFGLKVPLLGSLVSCKHCSCLLQSPYCNVVTQLLSHV